MKSQPRRTQLKKFLIGCLLLTIMAMATTFALFPLMSGDRESRPRILRYSTSLSLAEDNTISEQPSLKVMTMNMAHGRCNGFNQVFQSGKAIKANLDKIATVLKREKPDIVALQEADGPSIWSGGVNQIDFLAEKAGYPYSIRGEHVKGINLSYGTALLSMFPIKEPVSITFDPSPPTLSKGFVVATISLPGYQGKELDVVSLHLDFSRKSVRQRQIQDIIRKLSSRRKPSIVMGDFNCEWTTAESPLGTLAETFDLKGYQPKSPNMPTFPLLKRRIDWVLISPELDFMTYEVLPDVLSDHHGVVCELKMLFSGPIQEVSI